MKIPILFLFVLLGICLNGASSDTTRILFIGNSFTYYNNMPQMVAAFADSAGLPVVVGMHAPGGVSVGDTAQGNMAHMNNPVLYALIRSKKWDVVLIQDNQGRFVRDSAQFPGSSKVVEGHIKLMDSIIANNSCAKIVLFGGWGVKNGLPPYGNTGVEMIQRILRNYVVLNDTMKEIIAPIGEAWIKGINYLPLVDLWDTDQTHPSVYGSYLTASVIFSSVFNVPAKNLPYTAGLASLTASTLRLYADSVVFNSVLRQKYNLGGMTTLNLVLQGNQLTVPGNHASYKWYKNKVLIGTAASQALNGIGNYYALVKENDNSLVKTCGFNALITGLSDYRDDGKVLIFPNPASGKAFSIYLKRNERVKLVYLRSVTGQLLPLSWNQEAEGIYCSSAVSAGVYTVTIETSGGVYHKSLIVAD